MRHKRLPYALVYGFEVGVIYENDFNSAVFLVALCRGAPRLWPCFAASRLRSHEMDVGSVRMVAGICGTLA